MRLRLYVNKFEFSRLNKSNLHCAGFNFRAISVNFGNFWMFLVKMPQCVLHSSIVGLTQKLNFPTIFQGERSGKVHKKKLCCCQKKCDTKPSTVMQNLNFCSKIRIPLKLYFEFKIAQKLQKSDFWNFQFTNKN